MIKKKKILSQKIENLNSIFQMEAGNAISAKTIISKEEKNVIDAKR